MAFWDTWFQQPQQPTQISPKTQAITQTPAFQSAWPGWTSNYKTSTPYPPSVSYPSQPGVATTYPSQSTQPMVSNITSPWVRDISRSPGMPSGTSLTPYSPKTISQGGHDYWQDDIGYWHEIGITPESQATPTPMTKYQEAMIDYQLQELAATQGLNEDELALRRQQMYADAAYQNAQLAWQREQWGQQQAQEQQNYLANLAAEPHSWLEYAAASGQAPVIQPWMLPLESQQYSNLQAGQPIPGWSAENMAGMPNLINPSAQYWARMGPTSQQQYLGYQQADIGATPEESAWRLWSMSPPGGNMGLTQVR